MIKLFKYGIMTLITCGLSYLCFILPSEISGWNDLKSIGSVNLESLDEIKVDLQEKMTILEKLELLISQDSPLNAINVRQGKEYTQQEAIEAAKDGLKQLYDMGIIKNDDISSDILHPSALFYISPDDPTKSMIIWNINIIDEKRNIFILEMDDETGKILRIFSKKFEPAAAYDGEGVIKGLEEYLGIRISENTFVKVPEKNGSLYRKLYYHPVSLELSNKKLDCDLYLDDTSYFFSIME